LKKLFLIMFRFFTNKTASKFTLRYFQLEGRGGPIRNALAIGKVPYEDRVVQYPEWPAMKATLPYKQLPVIDIKDLTINQSTDLLRYACKLAGLYPDDALEALQVDSLITNMDHCFEDTIVRLMLAKGTDEEKTEMGRQFIDKKQGKLGMMLAKLDLQVGVSSKGFLFEFGLSGADLVLYQAICKVSSGHLVGIPKTYIRDTFDNLDKFRIRVASIEEISARFKDDKHFLHNSVWTATYKYDDE